MPRWGKLHAGLVLSIAIFLGLGYGLLQPKVEDEPPYLSFSADTDGTKALAELLARRHTGVKEWRLSWERLPKATNHLLVAIEPENVTKKDKEALMEWIGSGNHALIFLSSPEGWEPYGVETAPAASAKGGAEAGGKAADGKTHTVTVHRAGAGEAWLEAEVLTSSRLAMSSGVTEVLLEDDRGIIGERKWVKQGSLTVVLTPEWLMNGNILQYSHFELAWPLFAGNWNALWIDETHHGYLTSPGLLAVYPPWLLLACAQLGLALLLWLWRRGRRLGPVYTPRAWTVRRGDETLLAAAGWYRRAEAHGEGALHQQRFLRQLLLERWGLSPAATAQEVVQAARFRLPEAQAVRLSRLLEQGVPEERGRGSAKRFVECSAEIGEMIAMIEKEGAR